MRISNNVGKLTSWMNFLIWKSNRINKTLEKNAEVIDNYTKGFWKMPWRHGVSVGMLALRIQSGWIPGDRQLGILKSDLEHGLQVDFKNTSWSSNLDFDLACIPIQVECHRPHLDYDLSNQIWHQI
ncbi:unnamed protein product [Caenorhabditis angaria]|uniref:Uncharacterized protein n=1 Tax=Caenorhabditis angaria TaxID=860376 RepID=A0A9P1NCI8_9PELO|nr:unnamed protein product [Caenorhabditis angaria]